MDDKSIKVTATHRRRGKYAVSFKRDYVANAVRMSGAEAVRRGIRSMLARQAGGASMTESGDLISAPLGEFEGEVMTRGFSVDESELDAFLEEINDSGTPSDS